MTILYETLVSAGHWQDDEYPLKRTYVVQATDYGLEKMNELFNIQEPRLYQIGEYRVCVCMCVSVSVRVRV